MARDVDDDDGYGDTGDGHNLTITPPNGDSSPASRSSSTKKASRGDPAITPNAPDDSEMSRRHSLTLVSLSVSLPPSLSLSHT